MALILPVGPVGAGVLVIHSWWGLTPSYRDLAAPGADVSDIGARYE
ncbi:hypothetical protein [Maritimibacter fusiformis]|nr:hypothetical protein [Maritimibacter fusiformis]